MALNHTIKILVSKSQMDKLNEDKKRKGFKSTSGYLRHYLFMDNSNQMDTAARLIRIENALYEVLHNDRIHP